MQPELSGAGIQCETIPLFIFGSIHKLRKDWRGILESGYRDGQWTRSLGVMIMMDVRLARSEQVGTRPGSRYRPAGLGGLATSVNATVAAGRPGHGHRRRHGPARRPRSRRRRTRTSSRSESVAVTVHGHGCLDGGFAAATVTGTVTTVTVTRDRDHCDSDHRVMILPLGGPARPVTRIAGPAATDHDDHAGRRPGRRSRLNRQQLESAGQSLGQALTHCGFKF